MASISLRFTPTVGNTVTATLTVSDANAARLLAAHQTYLGTGSTQETADTLLRRALDEWIGTTKTVERNANQVAEIPVS